MTKTLQYIFPHNFASIYSTSFKVISLMYFCFSVHLQCLTFTALIRTKCCKENLWNITNFVCSENNGMS